MVDRGKCKFTVKVNFAEAAGASAVLIINNEKGNVFVDDIATLMCSSMICA